MADTTLNRLRAGVRSVDSEIVQLLARRLALAKKIGEAKRRKGVSVVDPATERVVIDAFVSSAAKAGIDSRYARRVACLLIDGSVEAQARGQRHDVPEYSALKRFYQLALKEERQNRKLIRLDIEEPRFRTPSLVVREAKRSIDRSYAVPPTRSSGFAELAEAISEQLNDLHGARLAPSNVLVFPAESAIFAAAHCTLSSHERAVVCQPSWPSYKSCVAMVGARAIDLPTTLEDRWEIDLNNLDETLRLKPKVFVVNYPNNPTGKVLPDNAFREMLNLAKKRRVTVISDEVYAAYSSSRVPSVLDHPDLNSICIGSFPEESSVTGWKLAYAVAEERTIERMSSFTEKMSVKVPDFVQRAVLAAFRAGKRELTSAKRMVAASVKSACEELKKTGWEFYAPDTGFYVFPQVARGKADSGKFAEYVLTKYGVGVLPGTVFGDYPEFLRLAIAGSSRTVRTAIERLRSASDEWSRR